MVDQNKTQDEFSVKQIPTINVLGINIHAINISILIERINELIQRQGKGYITLTGVHGIVESQKNLQIKDNFRNAFLSIPDGMPLVWIGKINGYKQMSRCYGPDVMLSILKWSISKGYTHYFCGGKPLVAQSLKTMIEKRFSNIKIIGTYTPPFRDLTEEEETEFIRDINTKTPNIIWVGMGGLKQDTFNNKLLPLLDTNLMFGVGAAFDFLTGNLRQAPRWIQRIGLEWFFRLMLEPRRLYKRYFKIVPLFIIYYTLQLLKITKYEHN